MHATFRQELWLHHGHKGGWRGNYGGRYPGGNNGGLNFNIGELFHTESDSWGSNDDWYQWGDAYLGELACEGGQLACEGGQPGVECCKCNVLGEEEEEELIIEPQLNCVSITSEQGEEKGALGGPI